MKKYRIIECKDVVLDKRTNEIIPDNKPCYYYKIQYKSFFTMFMWEDYTYTFETLEKALAYIEEKIHSKNKIKKTIKTSIIEF